MVSIDQNKCIGCGMCVKDCFFGVLSLQDKKAVVSGDCFHCGHCVSVCPTGALMLKSEVEKVDEAMALGRHVIVQTAPAVRAALGEEFGMPIGTPVTGKMVAALRRLGFEKVYDTDFGADLPLWKREPNFSVE